MLRLLAGAKREPDVSATGILETSTMTRNPARTPARPSTSAKSDYLIGLAITAGIPAAFWTGVVAGSSHLVGFEISSGALTAVAITSAGFLGAVYSAMSLRST